jgi:peptidoglycan/xylan/chitin deacetylase (PgdA/CDA1 family)
MRSTLGHDTRPDRAAAVVAALAFGILATLTPLTSDPPHPKTPSVAAPVLPVPTPVVLTEMARPPGSPPTVALTFDDGPDPRWTPEILDLLRRFGAVATFCVVGEQVVAHPDLVREIVADGHRLCDHTRTHDEGLPTRSAEDMADEVVGARADIAAAVEGASPTYFRAPGGNWSPDVLDLAVGSGMQPLGWSVDPRDWRRPGTSEIVEAVRRDVRPGAPRRRWRARADRRGAAAAGAPARGPGIRVRLPHPVTTPAPRLRCRG